MSAFQGTLFARDFLTDSIARLDEWRALDDAYVDGIESDLRAILDRFPTVQRPNESQTEDDLIWPVLARLGWNASLRQQNLTARGVEDVPDGLLFADDAAKARANALAETWKRYAFGLAIVESKRWAMPLDGRSDRRASAAPSTQMLRYLRRVDDLTNGACRWGILTNGRVWRLYHAGARSVAEQFFEVDLGAVLDLPGFSEGLFTLSDAERRHALKVFILVFRRAAFLPGAADSRTFHQRAIEEGAYYEQRVAANLSDLVFDRVFPELARAVAGAAPDAPLPQVRDAALTLLYRLLFILYAEDRELLPVRDGRYDTTACASECARTSGGARTAATSSPPTRRATGRRSTICRGPSTGATRRSGCRPTTADSSTRHGPRCSWPCVWAMRSWPTSSTPCRSSRPRPVDATSTTAT